MPHSARCCFTAVQPWMDGSEELALVCSAAAVRFRSTDLIRQRAGQVTQARCPGNKRARRIAAQCRLVRHVALASETREPLCRCTLAAPATSSFWWKKKRPTGARALGSAVASVSPDCGNEPLCPSPSRANTPAAWGIPSLGPAFRPAPPQSATRQRQTWAAHPRPPARMHGRDGLLGMYRTSTAHT